MKVKNIAFSGFMASILMAGAAYAVDAPTLATDKYVQDGVNYAISQAAADAASKVGTAVTNITNGTTIAAKATGDADGNEISATYLKSVDAVDLYEEKGAAETAMSEAISTAADDATTKANAAQAAATQALADKVGDIGDITVKEYVDDVIDDISGEGGLAESVGELRDDLDSLSNDVDTIDGVVGGHTGYIKDLDARMGEAETSIIALQNVVGDESSGLVQAVADNAAYIEANAATIETKQDALSEAQLSAVNSGVTATKVSGYDSHVGNTDIHVTADQKTEWSGKQDAISDLDNIRSGAALGATAVQQAGLNTALAGKQDTIDSTHKLSSDLVSGLGTAATTDSSAYATAAQGAKIDSLKCSKDEYCLISDAGVVTPLSLAITNTQWTTTTE